MEPIKCLDIDVEITDEYLKKFPDAEICFNANSYIDEAEAKRLMQFAIKRGEPLTEEERGFLPFPEADKLEEELRKMDKKDR